MSGSIRLSLGCASFQSAVQLLGSLSPCLDHAVEKVKLCIHQIHSSDVFLRKSLYYHETSYLFAKRWTFICLIGARRVPYSASRVLDKLSIPESKTVSD